MPRPKVNNTQVAQLNLFAEQLKEKDRMDFLVGTLQKNNLSNIKFIRTQVFYGDIPEPTKIEAFHALSDCLENLSEFIFETSRHFVILSPERCLPNLQKFCKHNYDLHTYEPLDAVTLSDFCRKEWSRLNGLFIALSTTTSHYPKLVLGYLNKAKHILHHDQESRI